MKDNRKDPHVIEIDLRKYPGLQQALSKYGNNKFDTELNGWLTLADWYYYGAGYTKKVFDMELYQFIEMMAEIFFDWKGILKHHHNPSEAKALEILLEENHPMAVFNNKTPAFDAKGNKITKQEFTSAESFTDFFSSMLYGLRFCSQKDLAEYLMLKEYDLVDQMKANNVQRLLKIQPALQYQKENNIPIGKYAPGSGFFYCGHVEEVEGTKHCPVCQHKSLVNLDVLVFCKECKAGFSAPKREVEQQQDDDEAIF